LHPSLRWTETSDRVSSRETWMIALCADNTFSLPKKETLHDPNTSTETRNVAQAQLKAMGRGKEAHVPLGVRFKSALRPNSRKPVAQTAPTTVA